MPIIVPSRDMPKLTLLLRLHALHRLVQPILICLLLCPTLAAQTGRKKKVTEELQCLKGILRADRSRQHNPLRKLDLLRPFLLRPNGIAKADDAGNQHDGADVLNGIGVFRADWLIRPILHHHFTVNLLPM